MRNLSENRKENGGKDEKATLINIIYSHWNKKNAIMSLFNVLSYIKVMSNLYNCHFKPWQILLLLINVNLSIATVNMLSICVLSWQRILSHSISDPL